MGRDVGGDVAELGGLVAEHEQIRALGHLGVALQGLPSHLGGKRGGTLGQRVRAENGRPHPRASARAMLPEPMRPICMESLVDID